jgi:type II secretion system protein N
MVLLTVLYLTFPYELVGKRLAEGFSQGGVQLAIGRLRPGFPPGLQAQQLRLLTTTANPPRPLFQIDNLRVQPDLLGLLSRSLQVYLEATIYQGRMLGNVHTTAWNGSAPWELKARLGEIRVEQSPLVQKDGKAFLHGRLGGEVLVTVNKEGDVQQGTLNLQLEPAVLAGSQALPFLLARDVTCDTVKTELGLATGQLQISSFTCRGDDLMLQVKGMIRWQQPLAASIMDLQIEIRSENAYKQELDLIGNLVRRRPNRGVLSFRLRGTFQEPRAGG